MRVPGAVAHHSIITENCRDGRGTAEAFDEAVRRARQQYDQIVDGWSDADDQPRIHLIVSLERP